MTCVAALVLNDGQMWMGADSAGADGGSWNLSIRRDPKVFRKGPWLMGFTSSFRMGQLLRWRLSVPHIKFLGPTDLEEFLATDFVDSVRDCFKTGGWAKRDNEQEEGGIFMVAVQGRLFTVYGDYQVEETLLPYAAIGCGASFALGAFHAMTLLNAPIPPEDRVRTALAAAELHSAGVRGPMTVLGP